MREYHVRICEGLGVKFPGSTRQSQPKLDVRSMSAFHPIATKPRKFQHFSFGPILLQKSFCTGDQKFCGLQVRLSCKDVRDPIASR
jgi:hypothetical protein